MPNDDAVLNLHDIALYGAEQSTLLGYFFGTPRQLTLGNEVTVTLSEGRSDDPFTVAGALLIDGAPNVQETLAPVESPIQVRRIPFSSDILLTSSGSAEAVVYFDGNVWFDLAPAVNAGVNQRIVPRQRLEGLRNLAELTNEEATMLELALAPQAPFVLAELPAPATRLRNTSGINDYRRSDFFLQTSLPLSEEAVTNNVVEPRFTVLAEGDNATVNSADFAVATSDTALISLWNVAYGNQLAQPPLPEVDFRRESVVAIFIGQRPTGGYEIDLEEVTIEDGEVYVSLRENEPAEDAITTQVLTSPWVMFSVTRPNLEIAWIRDADTSDLIAVARQ
jgi:hypothetical protein